MSFQGLQVMKKTVVRDPTASQKLQYYSCDNLELTHGLIKGI